MAKHPIRREHDPEAAELTFGDDDLEGGRMLASWAEIEGGDADTGG